MSTLTLDSDKEQIIAESINRFLFQKVWNEPGREFRNNINPQMLHTRSQNGAIKIYGEFIDLPTADEPYYIYAAAKSTMYGVAYPRRIGTEWISLEELITKHDILINVYHITGLMLNKGYCYIRQLPKANGYLIAVGKKMSSKIVAHSEMTNLRLTVYYDSDLTNKMLTKCYHIPDVDYNYTARNEILAYIKNDVDGIDNTIVYVNGYEKNVRQVTQMAAGDYVEVTQDTNAIFSFDIDLTDSVSNVAFLSDMDTTYKQLIHIPKKYNPDNKVLTHNTMDFFIRKKNPEEGDNGCLGLYVHRCAERSVTQVTHNDVAIPLYIIDAYRDYLKTQEVTLHVIVRQHSKDNVLIRDKNYIDLLYTLDDDTIINHLLGKISPKLDFWKAQHLESSVYIQTMFDVPDVVTPSNMTYYIDGLGYYHIMSLLCERMYTATVSDILGSPMTFRKPYVYQGTNVYPIVTLNGKKVHHDNITYVNSSDTELTVAINNNIVVRVGDALTLEVFVDGNTKLVKFTPVIGNTTIELPYREYTIYEEEVAVGPIEKYDRVAKKVYTPLTSTSGNLAISNTTSGVSLTFGPKLYNRTFVMVPTQCVYRWDYGTLLDELIQKGYPLYFDLTKQVYDDTTTVVPILTTPTLLVYLNGKCLIEGIDYTLQKVKDYKGHIGMSLMCLQNVSYLESTGNTLEIYVCAAHEENRVKGFVFDNKTITDDNAINLYFKTMSKCTVDGLAVNDAQDKGNHLEFPIGKFRNGAPFEIRTSVPQFISTYLSQYHTNDDIARIKILNLYFYGLQTSYPDQIILDKSHIVYSIYAAHVMRDIMSLTSNLSYDPDESRMKNQLAEYQYLADADLVTQKKLDMRFIDAYPHYKQFEVPVELYRVLMAFIKITMPDDPISNKQDVDITAV